MASLSGVFNFQQFAVGAGNTATVLAGGRVYTYEAGTTTHKVAYTDAAELVPQTYVSDGAGGLYIALNARGEMPAPLFLSLGVYDITLKTSAGVQVWTRQAIPLDYSDAEGTRVETVTATDGQTLITVPFIYTRGNDSLRVFVNGIQFIGYGNDYTETTTTSITVTRPLKAGAEVTFISGAGVNPASLTGTVSDVGLAAAGGAGLVGYSNLNTYAAGTVGYAIQQGIASGDYIGAWDADTNTPALADGVGVTGAFYIVNVAGTTTLDGISSWAVGDQVRFSGTVWEKISAAGATTAENVAFTPTDEVVETDVQAAIAGLGLDKAPIESPTFTGKVTAEASATGGAGLNLPQGVAPTTPVNGDVWTTSDGLYARVNGATQPIGNFTQAGTGALLRSTLGKQRDIVSVLDFAANGVSGARVDRSGSTDSTGGIQAALSLVGTAFAQPAAVYVPGGNYKVSSTLVIPNNVTVSGDNNWVSRVTMHTALSSPVLQVNGASGDIGHATIRDLFVSYNGTPTSGGDAIQINDAQNCTIDNVFVNGGYNGLAFRPGALNQSGNHQVSNFWCYNYEFAALYVEDTIDVSMTNFRFAAQSATRGAGGGIYLKGHCEAICCTSGDITEGVYGIHITRNGAGVTRDEVPFFNRFVNVFCDSTANNAILLDYAAHTDFLGCWAASAGYSGDYGNLAAISGVLMNNAQFIRFVGGDIYNNGAYGMQIKAGTTDVTVSDVTFRENFGYGGGASNGPAVYVEPNTNRFSFTNNTFDGTLQAGGTSHQNASIAIGSGTSTNFVITGNRMVSQPYTDASTGTVKFISQNIGQDNPIFSGTVTPTISASSGTIDPGTCLAHYVVRDGFCFYDFDCTMDATNDGAGVIRITIPFPTSSTATPFYYTGYWHSYSTGTTGAVYNDGAGQSTVNLVLNGNAYPGADSTRFVGSIRYAI